MRAIVERLLLALLAGALGTACGQEHPLRRVEAGEAELTGRGVLLIAVDALRWDRTSLGRSDRDTTPNLLALARDGVSFDDTWAPQCARFDAHVALLTGCDPVIARRPPLKTGPTGTVVQFPRVVPPGAPSLPVSLLAGGYSTAAFVDDPNLTKARGFERGFRDYVEYAGRGSRQFLAQDGTLAVGARLVQWLYRRELDEDWFAFVHIGDLTRCWSGEGPPVPEGWGPDPARSRRLPASRTDVHFHALPPSRASEGAADVADLELRYDAALHALDSGLGRIFALVDDFGRRDNVTVVVVGTYGMPFGESGIYLIPLLPDAPDLRVPWVVRPAASSGIAAGGRVSALASLMDVGPSILALAGLPLPAGLHGLARDAEMRQPASPPARRFTFPRGRLGGATVSEDRHWIQVGLPSSNPALIESWFGVPEPGGPRVVYASVQRAGPSSMDPVRVDVASGAAVGMPDLAKRWSEWNSALTRARDALQFGASTDASAIALELQRMQRGDG